MASLLTLPDEIKLKIFEYLRGIDKIELIKVCQDLQRVGTDRNVLQYLNFQLAYKLSLAHLRFIARKSIAIKVVILNLNGIHWIPPGALRNTLAKFTNLQALYVIDTQLSLRDLVKVMESATMIKKLAMSLKPDNCADVGRVKVPLLLTHLYVTYCSYSIRALIGLIAQFEKLEELWIIEPKRPLKYNLPDETPWYLYTNNTTNSLPRVSKRIVCNRQFPSIAGENHFLSSLKDESKKWNQVVKIRMENSLFYVFESNECETLPIKFYAESVALGNQKVKIGFCVGDSEKDMSYLRRWKPEASTQNLNEDKIYSFNERMPLLFSEEAAAIKKFHGCAKLFYKTNAADHNFNVYKQPEGEGSPEVERRSELFKKRRISPLTSGVDHDSPFKKFTLNTPNMEEFEIDDTDFVVAKEKIWSVDNFIFITNWKILKKLSITSINMFSGRFLIEITQNCPLLECLKVKDEHIQDRMSSTLCEALKYATNLKDFRYQRRGVATIDPLLEAVAANCPKLERLFIQCRHTVINCPLESVITQCENLIFLFILVSELCSSTCKSIKQRLSEFELKPKQIVSIRGISYNIMNIMYEDIPSIHVEEIVSQENDNQIYSEYLRTFFHH